MMSKITIALLSTVLTISLGVIALPTYAADKAAEKAAESHPAIAACKDKKLHNNCSYTTSDHKTMNGTCMARPKAEKELVCHPEAQHGSKAH